MAGIEKKVRGTVFQDVGVLSFKLCRRISIQKDAAVADRHDQARKNQAGLPDLIKLYSDDRI